MILRLSKKLCIKIKVGTLKTIPLSENCNTVLGFVFKALNIMTSTPFWLLEYHMLEREHKGRSVLVPENEVERRVITECIAAQIECAAIRCNTRQPGRRAKGRVLRYPLMIDISFGEISREGRIAIQVGYSRDPEYTEYSEWFTYLTRLSDADDDGELNSDPLPFTHFDKAKHETRLGPYIRFAGHWRSFRRMWNRLKNEKLDVDEGEELP